MSFFYSCKKQKLNIVSEGLKNFAGIQCYVAGEIFEPQINDIEVYKCLRDGVDVSDFVGDFSCLFEDDDFLYVINDELGTIKWFYSYVEGEFVISSDFWKVASELDVTVNDICKTSLYEIMLLGVPLKNRTWINGINVVPRGSILKFSKINGQLSINSYLDINYTESFLGDKEELFDKIDSCLKKTVNVVQSKNPDDTLFVSTSGGLDSRFPLPYLSLFKKVNSFLIGQKASVLEPFDLRNARKLTKQYGVDVKMVSPHSLDINDKVYLDVSRNPIGQSNILKAVDSRAIVDSPEHSVLLTGSHGGLIGGRVLNEDMLGSKNSSELSKRVLFYYSIIKNMDYIKALVNRRNENVYSRKFKTLLGLLFGEQKAKSNCKVNAEMRVDEFIDSDFLFFSEYKGDVLSSIEEIIENDISKGKNNLSVIMNYHLYRHSIRGVFESMLGQVRSYSIYMPYIYNFSKTWPKEYLSGRVVMEEFLYHRYKELSKVPLQSYKPAISDRISGKTFFLKRLKHVLSLGLRRLAIDYNVWWKRSELRRSSEDVMSKDSFFYKCFVKNDVLNLLNASRYTQLGENLYKYKVMVDAVEDGSYRKFINSGEFPSDSKY
ncbi:hypothetical protein [Neptuniibacter sp. QD34_54]|uniref:hypothetical protein n=1 Tax=Neptuniibacter sp. QD34_54 TaxID=3398208 RepID=UPI0039F5B316